MIKKVMCQVVAILVFPVVVLLGLVADGTRWVVAKVVFVATTPPALLKVYVEHQQLQNQYRKSHRRVVW